MQDPISLTSAALQPPAATLEDEFRKTEKNIKKYFTAMRSKRELSVDGPIYIDVDGGKMKLSKKDKARRLQEIAKVLDGGAFQASEIVDFRAEDFGRRGKLPRSSESCESEHKVEISPLSNDAVVCQLPKEMNAADGFYVITRALDLPTQLRWARTAVEQYSRSLHTNLTNLRKISPTSSAVTAAGDRGAAEGEEEEGEDLFNLWENSVRDADNFERFKPLRWASLGYHYDWTARKYQEHDSSPFPEDFAALCSSVAATLGLQLKPEAAIINYYPIGAVMSGHLDDAEHNLMEPIVSIR
jgi:hypothetical protein